MNITDHPSFVAGMRNYLNTTPPDFDSETSIARHITAAYNAVTEELNLSEEPLLSADNFLWSYNALLGIFERVEIPGLITLAQLYDGIYTAGDSGKPKRIRIGWQRANNIARSIHRLHELQAPKLFESPTPGICCTSGFLQVSEYGPELSGHNPDHAQTIAYDFDINPETEAPEKWLAFLDSLFENDEDKHSKIAVLQEFIGASISNVATTFQKCLLLLGHGSNGKSVLCDIIAELLFPEGTATFISPRRWDRDYSLAGLKNSKINIVTELPETSALESGGEIFKAVVAGDCLECRLPYQPPHFIRPSAGHIFAANELPHNRDHSHGFWRRWMTINFNVNFEDSPFRKTKTEIMDSLKDERGAIIVWALHGAARLIRRGDYTRVESHNETVAEWKKDSDAVYDFALSCLEYPATFFTPLSDLREEFRVWARHVGRCDEIGARTLSKRLAKIKGLERKRKSSAVGFQCSVLPIQQWRETVN